MAMTKVWPGFDKLQYLVVFGDSYSQTVYPGDIHPKPTPEEPLGVEWPGCTYNEDEEPNWVGHLIKRNEDNPLLVWNYATGGAQVPDVRWQVNRFLKRVPRCFTPKTRVSDNDANGDTAVDAFRYTLFSVFVGINDVCTELNVTTRVSVLFESAILPLYARGARNFIIFSNPSRIRPMGDYRQNSGYMRHEARVQEWNTELRKQTASFEQEHVDAAVLHINTWQMFNDIYDDPEKFQFTKADVHQAFGGGFWMDGLHPKSAVHKIISDAVLAEAGRIDTACAADSN